MPSHSDRPDSCNRAKRDARLERREPHRCPSPPFSEPCSCELLSAEKQSQCSQTGLFSSLNKNKHYFPSKELGKEEILHL